MTPANVQLPLYRGDNYNATFRLRYKNPDGTSGDYLDLTGCTPLVQIRLRESSPVLVTVAATILDQTDPATKGGVTIALTGGDTASLPTLAEWDFQLTHPDNTVLTYLAGPVVTNGQVST